MPHIRASGPPGPVLRPGAPIPHFHDERYSTTVMEMGVVARSA